MTVTVFGYLIIISIDFSISFLRFLLSFRFDWEDKSNTQDSVWPHYQTPRAHKKKTLRYASYFQFSSWCLKMWSNTVFRVWYITWINWLSIQWKNTWLQLAEHMMFTSYIPVGKFPSGALHRLKTTGYWQTQCLDLFRYKRKSTW